MAKIFYEKDASISEIVDLSVGVIGYGNQGRAQALNLRDSGIKVRIGARKNSRSYEQAVADHFAPDSIEEIATNCDLIAILLPDEAMPDVYTNSIEPYLSSGKSFVFAHGFAIHHKLLRLPDSVDILLVAPTGPGKQLRSLFTQGKGLPALVAVEQDFSGVGKQRGLAYAQAIGCTRAGCIETTFAEETVTDLYCEQAVLCGGMPELIKKSFETLVNSGYQPELAYISCLKEVKLIADLLFSIGMDGMKDAISNTAKYGAAITGPELINASTQARLEQVLQRIERGTFARDFMAESKAGHPTINNMSEQEKRSKMVRTGKALKDSLEF
ncbi:MAG: ketol-acid reductoisomerase [Candidatus Obscuribacterales bacterium]|nr:ketol-acid reductoisomerase [Candidatus Obscuribacterales bacterium]